MEYVSFDRVAHEYDETRVIPAQVLDRAASAICTVAHLNRKSVFLDAGVGTGRFALAMGRRVTVVGLDISWEMLSRLHCKAGADGAVDQSRLRVARADLRAMPIRSASADALLLVHILHLIADWTAVLSEARRVLRPTGALVLGGESSHRAPLQSHYYSEARRQGVFREHIGAKRVDDVVGYLSAQGAALVRCDDPELAWTATTRVGDSLRMLRRRTWSNTWSIPDEPHRLLMEETERWALDTYGSLDAEERVNARLDLLVVRWSAP